MSLVLPVAARCPHCKGAVFLGPWTPAPGDGHPWSDGWFGDGRLPDLWRSKVPGPWARCPRCHAKVDAAALAEVRNAHLEADWKDAPSTQPLPPAQVIDAVDDAIRGKPGPDQERRLRMQRRHASHHARRGDGPDVPLEPYERINLERLLAMPEPPGFEGALQRPELLRELGRFADAKALLREMRARIDRVEAEVDAGNIKPVVVQRRNAPEGDGYPREMARDMGIARSGDGEAAWRTYERFAKGLGAPRDPTAARQWLQMAVSKGNVAAHAQAGREQIDLGGFHFAPGIKLLAWAARRGHGEAREALHLRGPIPPGWRAALENLGTQGSPEAILVLLAYVEAARASLDKPVSAGDRETLAGLVELLRDNVLKILAHADGVLPEAVGAECRDTKDFALDPVISFAQVRAVPR